MERLLEILRLTKFMDDPVDVIAELESEDVHRDNRPEKKMGPGDRRSGDRKPWERLREPEKPKHQQSPAAKMQVGHELPAKHQKVRRKR
jgi:hypothetical protein